MRTSENFASRQFGAYPAAPRSRAAGACRRICIFRGVLCTRTRWAKAIGPRQSPAVK
jgi:hypothetical protein